MSLWEDAIRYGVHGDRPAAGLPGRLYFESDTGNGYRDNGLGWDVVAPTVARQIQSVSANTTLTSANLFVLVTGGAGSHITLPDPALYTGLPITLKASGGSYAPKNPDGSAAENDSQDPWNAISDGTVWRNVDF